MDYVFCRQREHRQYKGKMEISLETRILNIVHTRKLSDIGPKGALNGGLPTSQVSLDVKYVELYGLLYIQRSFLILQLAYHGGIAVKVIGMRLL